jgi:hypothetical protein
MKKEWSSVGGAVKYSKENGLTFHGSNALQTMDNFRWVPVEKDIKKPKPEKKIVKKVEKKKPIQKKPKKQYATYKD